MDFVTLIKALEYPTQLVMLASALVMLISVFKQLQTTWKNFIDITTKVIASNASLMHEMINAINLIQNKVDIHIENVKHNTEVSNKAVVHATENTTKLINNIKILHRDLLNHQEREERDIDWLKANCKK